MTRKVDLDFTSQPHSARAISGRGFVPDGRDDEKEDQTRQRASQKNTRSPCVYGRSTKTGAQREVHE